MTRPFFFFQLSDPHVGADWGARDSVAWLGAAVEYIRALEPNPDAVLISGDLYVLPGNHDDRLALRGHFGVLGDAADLVQYAADLGPLRLVALDTKRNGQERGELDAERLAWLEATLAAAPDTPTLLALHHAPSCLGFPRWTRSVFLRPTDAVSDGG